MAKKRRKNATDEVLLMEEVVKSYQGFMHRATVSAGMLSSYRPLLSYLARQDGVNQLSMVRITGFRPPTISVTLRRMETEGLVWREASKEDGRAMLVHLTERGKKLQAEMSRKSAAACRVMKQGISEEDLAVFQKVLEQMKVNTAAEGWCADGEEAD